MARREYILENAVIYDGPPVRYQITPKKKNLVGVEGDSRLRRWTIGKKDPTKENKTILLVGETGSGKSTMINSILNYVMGVKEEDGEWFEIIERDLGSETKTTEVTIYEIFGFEDKTVPYSITIIDTPGYGDTREIEYDAIITQSLHELFHSEDGIQELHAVALVLKATENRLNDRLRYVFDVVMSLFGKDMEKNIVALITHSDGMPPENALEALEDGKIKCARNEKKPVYFVFNNCLSEEKTEETEPVLSLAWVVTTRGMKQFTGFLEKITPQKLKTTVSVLDERIKLAACINNLTDRIELIELKKREIQQTEEELEKHKETLDKEDTFKMEVDEPYKVKVDIDGGMWLLFLYSGAVTCPVCEENCHYPGCTMAWKPEYCEVMKDGRCTSCTGKCPVSDHMKEKKMYVTKTRKVKKTISQLKDKITADKDQCENLMSSLQTKKEKLEKEKDKLLDEAYQHVVALEQIALNVNSLLTHVHLDFLIKKMEEKGDEERVQKLEDMVARVDKGTRAGLKQIIFSFGGQVNALGKVWKKVWKEV